LGLKCAGKRVDARRENARGRDMPPNQTTIKLNDGHEMPAIGFGTGQLNERTDEAVGAAIAAGYRLIDTASRYKNEARVGHAVRASGLPRQALFVTTKVWPDSFGHDAVLTSFAESLERLNLDSVDLFLLHWPAPWLDLYVESWRALIRLREAGKARSIGVSNFTAAHIQRLVEETGVIPAVNQVELHPRFQQAALRTFHAGHGIATMAWSPLGQGAMVDDSVLAGIGAKHGKSAAQVALRWHFQSGVVPIPKSADAGRIAANIDIFDFELDADDLAAIAALDSADGRLGSDPEDFPR
jgi:2,5-diketo-D-gluconate reductase A